MHPFNHSHKPAYPTYTVLCITIFFSWIFANLGFMSVLAQFKIPMIKKMKNSSDADVESKEDGDMVVANA